jgi:NADH dehydrogenase
MRVVIVGGGYAGLSCLLRLRRRCPDADLHLVDAGTAQIKNNHLHQTLARPIEDFSHPYAPLTTRLGCTFHQCVQSWSEAQLLAWHQAKALPLATGSLPFDFLVLATGAQAVSVPVGDFCYDLVDFRQGRGPKLMEEFRGRVGDRPASCTVVGSGPSGIQFLFALHEQLKSWRIIHRLALVTLDSRLVADLPQGFHEQLLRAMGARDMQLFPDTRYLGQSGTGLSVQPLHEPLPQLLASDLTLLFPGVAPRPTRLYTNPLGQVRLGEHCLEHIFAAGDCAWFEGDGLNSLTAQAALRKGRLVADNLAALAGGRTPSPYTYRERGFFLALGPFDGLGWIGRPERLLGGLAAMAAKELLEAQYDLLLKGLDTFGS